MRFGVTIYDLRWTFRATSEAPRISAVASALRAAAKYHYGAVAAAFEFFEKIALRGAGLAQEFGSYPRPPGHGHFYSVAPYGDFEDDQEMIKKGYAFYNNFKTFMYGEFPYFCGKRQAQ